MDKNTFTIEITRKDKIYLSIILALVCMIICFAICLPRAYKVVEKEVVVYKPQYVKVYDTKHCYLISATSPLYDYEKGYYQDAADNKYVLGINETYVSTGALESVNVSVITNKNGLDNKNTILLEKALIELFVLDQTSSGFGVEIDLDYFIMQNIKNMFITNLGEGEIGVLDNFLFEFKFQNAEVNIIVSFLSE